MGAIGSSGVTDYTNTTSASATGVMATGGVGGGTVSAYPSPATTDFIVTQSGQYIVTESDFYLIT